MEAVRIAILLLAIGKFKGERTVNGLIHLLKGKRSIQTIQDGYIFRCLTLFKTFEKLDETMIFQDIGRLKQEGLIVDNGRYLYLTEKGKNQLQKLLLKYPFIKMYNGWKYKDVTYPFWKRLLLFVQTLSFTAAEQYSFYPAVNDESTKHWVKTHFPKTNEARRKWCNDIYTELSKLLSPLPNGLANVFVSKFSGFDLLGLTNEQIREKLSLAAGDVELMLMAVLHYMLENIVSGEKNFPRLSLFVKDITQKMPLTQSAQKTFECWKKGRSIEEIARFRRLKKNTIEDHLIEIMIADPSLSIDDFVSPPLQQTIKNVMDELQTTKLRPIKERLGEDVSYFQIRLVLTRI